MRGFLIGSFLGLTVAVVMAVALSFLLGLPSADAPRPVSLDVPPGSQFNQSRDDTTAQMPRAEQTTQSPDVNPIAAPPRDDLAPLSDSVTQTLAQPDTAMTDEAMQAPAVGQDDVSDLASAGDAPVGSAPRGSAPVVPARESGLSISTDPAQPVLPGTIEQEASGFPASDLAALEDPGSSVVTDGTMPTPDPAASVGASAESPVQPMFSADTETRQPDMPLAVQDKVAGMPATTPPRPATISSDESAPAAVASPPAPQQEQQPEPRADQTAQVRPTEPDADATRSPAKPKITINRLPSINGTEDEAEVAPDDTAPPVAQDAEPEDRQPLARFAADYDYSGDKPLMSVVLIDDGSDSIGVDALGGVPFPITIALDAQARDAVDRMARYRAAGYEVLAMLDVPAEASPRDVEVNLGATLRVLTEAVGVLEGPGSGLQSTRSLSDQVNLILSDRGYGLVLMPKGLNTGQKLARKVGVPAITVFRDFDSNDQNASVIRRFLDQAAFKAAQEDDGIVMLGHMRAETISALILWGVQDRAERVALAPVSTLLQQVQK